MLIFKNDDQESGNACSALCIESPNLTENVEIPISKVCLEDKRWLSHQIGHALGLKHEHQRPDRDRFIDVHTENVIPEAGAKC